MIKIGCAQQSPSNLPLRPDTERQPHVPAFLFGAFLALAALMASEWAQATPPDVLLLKNDASGVSLRYYAQLSGWVTTETPDRTYSTPQVRLAGGAWPVGAPQLPARVIWLVIPPNATAVLTGAIPHGVISSANVPAPVPTMVPAPDGSPISIYEENPEYYQAGSPFPAVWVDMEGPEPYRNLNVIRLLIYPFRFPSASGGLLGLDSIDVRVAFQGGSRSANSLSRPIESEFYSGFITNWTGPAQTWKVPRLPQAEVQDLWPAGDLYKIEIDESGIYKLTYSNLVQAGIDLNGLDPQTIRIFNNGGRVLPDSLIVERPQGPIENAISVHDGGTIGSFDPGDEIWFYGRSVHDWEWNPAAQRFQHYQNPYADRNVYWLNINPSGPEGKHMQPLGLTSPPTRIPETSRAHLFEEKEIHAIFGDYNLPIYMPNLYGDLFSGLGSERSFSFYLEEIVSSVPAILKLKFQYGEGSSLRFDVYINNEKILTTNGANLVEVTIDDPDILQDGNNTLRLEHLSTGTCYLDYFEIHYTRHLDAAFDEIAFISPDADGIAEYQIGGLSSPWIFDVTNFDNVRAIEASSFRDSCSASSPRRYIALDASALKSPLSISKDRRDGDEYLNLRSTLGADILVVAGDAFYDAMAAYEDYREGEAPSPAEVLRVRISDIFDEYGWGLRDPSAIRDFLKSTLPLYNWAVSPLYILFAGDGDFDYKNKLSSLDDNWVIPYVTGSTCTDDWYAYFTAWDEPYAYPQFALGRWPVQSVDEVEEMINRVTAYESSSNFGPWRDRLTFVADDEYGQGGGYSSAEEKHVRDTEDIVENYMPDIFNVRKIYLTEYPASQDPAGGGRRKPEAAADLVAAINDGCILVNYFGHGNPTVWAHEHVFLQSRDLPLLANGSKWPLFVAFTCDWAYWDSPFDQSMPEILLTLPGGGAIATLAATRTTDSNANAIFARAFYGELFSEPTGLRLGEAMLCSKASFYVHKPTGSGSNNVFREMYHLLGDPFLKLAMPQLQVAINPGSSSTLIALDRATVLGEIRTQSGVFLPSFEGIAHLQVFDTRITVLYEFPKTTPPPSFVTYYLPGDLIFRGDVSVNSGQFESTFVVPVDINYGGAGGRYSIYAYSDQTDGAGADDEVVIGESVVALQDTIPPAVKVYFDSPGFMSGDPVSPQATLYVEVSDSNGVNITGSAGHGIVVTVDGANPLDLTDSFGYYLDSYTSGRAEYKLTPGLIAPGIHTAEAMAWDAANNPSMVEVSFEMVGADGAPELRLTDVLNYPNPFKHGTRFTFYLTEAAEVTIKIYTVAGRLVKVIPGVAGEATFNWDQMELFWDGRDERGDLLSNGVYIYKVLADAGGDRKAEETSKLIIMR